MSIHLPTENSGECSACWLPWPCDVAIAWERAHAAFCPRVSNGVDYCSTHLRPGDRYAHQASTTEPHRPDSTLMTDERDQLWAAIEGAFLDTTTHTRQAELDIEAAVERIIANRHEESR